MSASFVSTPFSSMTMIVTLHLSNVLVQEVVLFTKTVQKWSLIITIKIDLMSLDPSVPAVVLFGKLTFIPSGSDSQPEIFFYSGWPLVIHLKIPPCLKESLGWAPSPYPPMTTELIAIQLSFQAVPQYHSSTGHLPATGFQLWVGTWLPVCSPETGCFVNQHYINSGISFLLDWRSY